MNLLNEKLEILPCIRKNLSNTLLKQLLADSVAGFEGLRLADEILW